MSTPLADPGRPARPRWLVAIVGVVVVGLVAAVVGGAAWTSGTLAGLLPAPEAAVPRFVDETSSAGLDHRYDGEFSFFVGGGVAAFDCDDDGRPELYLAGGSGPAGLYRNRSAVGGALAFERLADPVTDLGEVTGAYPLDIDSDGHTDLAVLRLGENVVLRGLGECRFERADEVLGLDGADDWTAAFSATWEGDATLPTLAFGNYLAVDASGAQTEGCAPGAFVRPTGDGTYGAPIPLEPGLCSLSLLFSDWDRSGRRDLRVSNDRHYYREGQEQLWRVEPGVAPTLYDAADGWGNVEIWGMGIASQDLTGDGRPEVYLTSQGDNKLQTLVDGASGPAYRDIALERGVTAHRPFAGGDTLPSTAWHPEFQDVNNDGHTDLFVSKGNVEAMVEFAAKDPSNLLIGQADGTFIEGAETAGILGYSRGRGAALVDLNLDGLLDLVQVNRREPVGLWRNVGSGDATTPAQMGHWAAVRLSQDGVNRDAIGAWLTVRAGGRTVEREITVGGGHAGGQLGWVHFGLGDATTAEVRVQWPDGDVGPWLPLPADGFVVVERGATDVRPWTPGG